MDEYVSRVEYIGPFEHHEVIVDGWQVPLLTADPQPGGQIALTLDDRFGLELSVQEAERIMPFVAHCIAVGLGFAAHPDEGVDEPKQLPHVRPRRTVALDLQAGSAT